MAEGARAVKLRPLYRRARSSRMRTKVGLRYLGSPGTGTWRRCEGGLAVGRWALLGVGAAGQKAIGGRNRSAAVVVATRRLRRVSKAARL